MKKLLLRVTVFILGCFFFSSCGEDLNIEGIPVDENAVSFYVDASGVVSFNEGTINQGILVSRNYVNDNIVTVNYSIEELGAVQGVDYVFQSAQGVATIPSGQASTPILFNFPDNEIGGEVRQFRLTITQVEGGFVGDESPGRVTSVIINIIDDDCDFPIPTSYTGSVFAFGATGPSFDVEFVAENCDDLGFDIATAWGPEFVAWATGSSQYSGQFLYAATVNYDPATHAVEVVGADAWATGGTGSYDPATGQISYTLTQDLFTTDFTVDVVLTPN